MDRSVPTKRQRLLDAAASVLEEQGSAMHFSALAAHVYARLGLSDDPPARLNGVLHDDSSGRFRRTGRGTWSLARWA
ncbi:MAG TPA: winged helix-turn-helix domain-containing protein [Gemmatimonadaceae bacterium]|nr:winged helix-turn-helix domain-containing protein [Gemmatimonadaceae bacterium]